MLCIAFFVVVLPIGRYKMNNHPLTLSELCNWISTVSFSLCYTTSFLYTKQIIFRVGFSDSIHNCHQYESNSHTCVGWLTLIIFPMIQFYEENQLPIDDFVSFKDDVSIWYIWTLRFNWFCVMIIELRFWCRISLKKKLSINQCCDGQGQDFDYQ